MYFSFGFILTSLFYYLVRGCKNQGSKTGLARWWIDLGIRSYGVTSWKKVLGLIVFAMLF